MTKVGEKEITINTIRTRGNQKAYNQIIYSDSKIGSDGRFEINMSSLDNANDFMIKTLTSFTDEEISALDNKDYTTLLDKCSKIKDGSGSK